MDDIYGYQNNNHRQAIISLIAAGVLLLVILFLVLWLVFWRSPSSKSTSTTKGTQTSQQQSAPKPTPSTGTQSQNSKSSSSNGNSSAANQSPAATPQLPSDEATNDDNLTNTGPGDVYALFAVTVIAATAFRYRQLSRRSR